MNMEGQAIYIYDAYDYHKPMVVAHGFIVPQVGEELTIFNEDEEMYYMCKVVKVFHTVNTGSGQLRTIVNVECYKKSK